jgi:uncharacterized protein (TIGR03083 family)
VAWLELARYHAELETETARLGAVASGLEPQTRVPTCPEWTIRDLVTHVGTGHRWAAEIVEGGLLAPPPYMLVGAPPEPAMWADWLAAGAHRLGLAVRDGGPDRTVWTWQADRTAGFWLRRMVHDELVHRFDAEIAAGCPGEVAADLAADGVSDLLASIATLSPADSAQPVFAGLVGTGQAMRLQAIDADPSAGEWLVQRTPAGVAWRHGRGPADVAVVAPARELLLVMNRRLDPTADRVRVVGDQALFTHWLEHSRF